MTRRRLFARRPLNLQSYLHRATVGLPKAERLDAAAELRTHLVEQIDRLRAAGHPADEAEYLAVQTMGDPAPTNRGLLGHAFTHKAGWAVLGAVLLGGGGWAGYGYIQREWMPPREGVWYSGSTLSLDDLTALNADQSAPRSTYQTATVTYPKGTRTIYYALVAPNEVVTVSKDVQGEQEDNLRLNNLTRFPGSYRYQERWLIADQAGTPDCPKHWSFYIRREVLTDRFARNSARGLPQLKGECGGIKRLYQAQAQVSEIAQNPIELMPTFHSVGSSINRPDSLPLNSWTLLRQLVIGPRTTLNQPGPTQLLPKATGMYLAVFASDQAIKQGAGLHRSGPRSAENIRNSTYPFSQLFVLDQKTEMFFQP